MKLASLKHGRDGKLVVVSRDLTQAVAVDSIAPTMQWALDNWHDVEQSLKAVYTALQNGSVNNEFSFNPQLVSAPLPRAFQWLDGSGFTTHGDLLVRALRLAENPQRPGIPLMYQGGSDSFIGATEDVPFESESYGIDFEGEFAAILGDTPMGTQRTVAGGYIRLLTIANDWSLRGLAPAELKTGFGWTHAKTSTSFSPVAVTPDELGNHWADGKIHLDLRVTYNQQAFGHPNGSAMTFDFNQLIEHAAATRKLTAGTVIGSGTVAEADPERVGSACLAERRGVEMIHFGEAKTPLMKFGDQIRMEVFDQNGESVFGAIDQRITQWERQS